MQNLDAVWQKAEQVFGDRAKAAAWLSTLSQLFGGEAPIDFVKDQEDLEGDRGADSDRAWVRLLKAIFTAGGEGLITR